MRILIVYATGFGQTLKVVNFLAERFRALSHSVDVREAAQEPDPSGFDAVIVASSIRVGAYASPVLGYARRYRAALSARPSAFLSVSMAAASTINREAAFADLRKRVATFEQKTGWHPVIVHHVAGAVPFTRYGFLTKWIMKRIGQKEGRGADTSRDYEYTDWGDLSRFAESFLASIGAVPAPAAASGRR